MEIIKIPENAEKVISYDVDGNMISFNDEELALNLKKREKDYPVHIDICTDKMGALVCGTVSGLRYVAQIDIPAREYKEVRVENPNYNPDDEMSQETITTMEAVPFDINKCTLTLWEMED